MINTSEITDLLNQLATSFENVAEAPGHDLAAPDGCRGWGQFLDARKPHKQVGLYGTCAGIIVLALARRGNDVLGNQAAHVLDWCWKSRSDPASYSYQKMLQTPRLAFLNLALRLSGIPGIGLVANEIEQTLLNMRLASELWGNFWISPSDHDPTPRLFPSALALLSLSLFKGDPTHQDPRLSGTADSLEELYMSKQLLPTYQEAAVAAALLSTKATLSRRTGSRLRDLALANSRVSGEGGVYFYDFEYGDGADGSKRFGRDYFIVPPELILGIVGFQHNSPGPSRLLAESILSRLASNIRANNGTYLSTSEQRITSNNQAWAALLLSSASRSAWQVYRLRRALARLGYEARRERMGNRFTEVWLPFISMVLVVISGVVLRDEGGLITGVVAVAALMIGGLYGPEVVRRLFPGRG